MVYHTHVNPNHMVYRQGVIYHFLGVIYHIRTFQMNPSRTGLRPPAGQGPARGRESRGWSSGTAFR